MKTTPCYLKTGSFQKEISRSDALVILLEHRRLDRRFRVAGFKSDLARRLVSGWMALGAFDLFTR